METDMRRFRSTFTLDDIRRLMRDESANKEHPQRLSAGTERILRSIEFSDDDIRLAGEHMAALMQMRRD